MNEKKLARICWNDKNWQFPSGKDGKVSSSNSSANEAKTGYGHEEWLFDTTKLIDGFHYGHLQAIYANRALYENKIFDISLYTINSSTKERWWLGEVLNIHVVSEKESKAVFLKYKKNGWLNEMHSQLETAGADVEDFKGIEPGNFTCVKFKPSDLRFLEEPKLFSKVDPAVTSDYYNLKNKTATPLFLTVSKFTFTPSSSDKKSKSTATYRKSVKDIDLIHNQMQSEIYQILMNKYGVENVACEQDTTCGTKIDIAVKIDGNLTFYEIKTSNTSKQCIREALSQLLEYSYYPNTTRAHKLVIIAPVELSNDSEQYLNKLRVTFKIPIFYQKYNLEEKLLGREI